MRETVQNAKRSKRGVFSKILITNKIDGTIQSVSLKNTQRSTKNLAPHKDAIFPENKTYLIF
jgi:hypothetical protein